MRLYFDTSALAKAYTSERGSADVDDFLARGTTVFLSDLPRGTTLHAGTTAALRRD